MRVSNQVPSNGAAAAFSERPVGTGNPAGPSPQSGDEPTKRAIGISPPPDDLARKSGPPNLRSEL